MTAVLQRVVCATITLALTAVCADSVNVAKEKQIPQKPVMTKSVTEKARAIASSHQDSNYKAFTGKIVGNGVRMRLHPDMEGQIVRELLKNELVVIVGEKNDFYVIEAPSDMKVYVFRSFILDNVVEGNRVNVRLAPELNAPIVGYLNTGDRVTGIISDKNHKWLEISPPKTVRFFIAKEYVENVGGPEIKALRDKKQITVSQLMETSELLGQSEMMKPFEEIDFERISESFNTVINEYTDFPQYTAKAKAKLMELQETYLQKKLAYLESKASRMSREMSAAGTQHVSLESPAEVALSPKDRMKIWERVEESHFLAWASSHHQKTMDDFYEDQKLNAAQISGILEIYNDVVKNKPGAFILRDRDMPKAYLYSTFVDLNNYVGKYVTLHVTPRPNNNFAFPAYFVLEVE